MTDATAPYDTEPPIAGDEVSTLLAGLERQRAIFAWKVSGLDEAGLAFRIESSELTLGGLIKHLAFIEDLKFNTMVLGEDLVAPWDAVDWENDQRWPWYSAAKDSPEDLYGLWHDAVGRARVAIDQAIAEGGLDMRARYGFGDDPENAFSLRRMLFDTIEEYARHAGHADLIREALDGLVGQDPPGAVYPFEPPAGKA
ncbi:MAG TPA: DUF664 domain-containing protein [Asanoa sp.]|nr:DUF664 domain-containing protein [Asanoa sp.]